jgi:hypothetical protein
MLRLRLRRVSLHPNAVQVTTSTSLSEALMRGPLRAGRWEACPCVKGAGHWTQPCPAPAWAACHMPPPSPRPAALQVVCWATHPVRLALKFKAHITTVGALSMPIVPGQQFTLHSHMLEEPCNITRLLRTLDKDSHTKQVRGPIPLACARSNAHNILSLAPLPAPGLRCR